MPEHYIKSNMHKSTTHIVMNSKKHKQILAKKLSRYILVLFPNSQDPNIKKYLNAFLLYGESNINEFHFFS